MDKYIVEVTTKGTVLVYANEISEAIARVKRNLPKGYGDAQYEAHTLADEDLIEALDSADLVLKSNQ